MRKLLASILWLLGSVAFSQIAPDVYLVQFTDKDNSPYSIDRPQDFLSLDAIERRARFDIEITEQDLPVNPEYVQAIRELAPVKNISKWFNSVNVTVTDPAILQAIEALPFVRHLKSKRIDQVLSLVDDKFDLYSLKTGPAEISNPDTSFYNYGLGGWQIGMLNGHILHNQGYSGQGMKIAVLDGGFKKVNTNTAFDSLRNNNQILGSWDFVHDTPLSYNEHSHGAQVLSIMAANIPGVFVGAAPKASYYLLRTENAGSEYLVEEDNWIRAIEYADSAGVDLVNSSLSYTDFDIPDMDHTYADLDGNTTRITMAADIAASKGILVVTSAANEGETEWLHIGAPADGDSVLTVGAVDADRVYAPFSSIGPSFDGRIKPNITAQGRGTYFAGTNGSIYSGSGTSFSSPIICGLAACLWQSNKSVNNFEIIQILQKISSQADNPDNYLGYGLPDFTKGFFQIQGIDLSTVTSGSFIRTFPNPFISSFSVDYYSEEPESFSLELWDMMGRLVYSADYDPGYSSFKRVQVKGVNMLNNGMYVIRIISSESVVQSRIMKQEPKY